MQKILIINAGSTSIKFSLFEMPSEKLLISGNYQALNSKQCDLSIKTADAKNKISVPFQTFEKACQHILDILISENFIKNYQEINACGHRIVHGADYFDKSVIIDEKVEAKIESLFKFAPLHNPVNLQAYKIFSQYLKCAHVAIFDTSFHTTIPSESYLFPIPREFYEQNKLRRYGFHGTSYRYILQRMQTILNKPSLNLIVSHIGGGCSVCAIKNNKSFATSMGYGPLGGVMMATRSGDIDPTVIQEISAIKNISIDSTIKILNNFSGIKGSANLENGDFRTLEEQCKNNNIAAIESLNLFIRRIVDFIAQYYFLLEAKVDAFVFCAGIPENAVLFRQLILSKLQTTLNLKIDEKQIDKSGEILLTSADSTFKVFIIPTNEEIMMARDVNLLIK